MTKDGAAPDAAAVPVGPMSAEDVLSLDARSLRGLAHPLRMRLLAALRDHGPATASQLADRLGESSGATSYHLRQLAAHGFVEDVPERGTARERWWRSVYRGDRLDSIEEFVGHPDPQVRGAVSTFLFEHATSSAAQLTTWLSTMHEWPQEWQRSWDASRFTLRLTPEQAQELSTQVHALIEGFRERESENRDDGSERLRVQFHAFPVTSD